jgi:DNA-binding CsgD family transcriptional regulator
MPNQVVKPGSALTPREKRALTHAAFGLSNSQIATRMGVPPGTVEGYLHRCYKRLRARNRAHAVALALVRGDIKLPTAPDGSEQRGTL